jgi:hypothetical protein
MVETLVSPMKVWVASFYFQKQRKTLFSKALKREHCSQR